MDSFGLREALGRFLTEDLGSGDITSESIFGPEQEAEAVFIAKTSLVTAGMAGVAGTVFTLLNPAITVKEAAADGSRCQEGDILLRLQGPVLDLLKAERVALNLAQRLCGIATLTARFVAAVSPLPVKLVDTRKTTPGLRMLEKYAVRVGGGYNHRFNLADAVLIKDNHLDACGSVREAVERVRRRLPHTMKIEVEAETLAQIRECLECGVEIILLDNMTVEELREAVRLAKGKALLEASGGVTLENVRRIAETGVDLISVGALTHSAPASDISMRLSPG